MHEGDIKAPTDEVSSPKTTLRKRPFDFYGGGGLEDVFGPGYAVLSLFVYYNTIRTIEFSLYFFGQNTVLEI